MLSPELENELERLPVILSVPEVMVFLSVCRNTVYRMIDAEELAAYKDGTGTWNINRSDLIALCRRNSNL
ncbi:helix-turn-helix domain-containing protein [Breznakiella homolactica]|uniref:Helix-turn-helix domain-containing protein n=1 Tax=Breznakiella homolactica TaxID=2798577 RepID=A0A7T8BA25_9SPIR|nr:helix-turn-helix domain-containing protein [Breznakiella homolactica]QQO10219.1 helix-turn-helix domain-containing protein [Breznakiella homolactica]